MADRPLLLVDDDPINLAMLRQVLEPDYPLVFARNGAEAIQAVAKHHPSLILLDIQMPDMDGYTVCKTLKGNPVSESIPVIFVTALSDMGNEKTGFSVGCVDYLIKPVSADIVRARVKTHLSLVKITQLQKSYQDAVFMLGEAGHYRDTDTGEHIWRMAAYSRILAKAAGWPADHCELLGLAAAMHDTGKIGLPDAVLQKPGKLNAEEWAIIQTHTQIGHDILSKSDAPVFRLAAEIALNHHEKWDGSGYPHALSGTDIPKSARIVAVADVFDALSMKRPYKEPWPIAKIVPHLNEGAGYHFEPEMIECFMDMLPRILTIMTEWEHTVPAS